MSRVGKVALGLGAALWACAFTDTANAAMGSLAPRSPGAADASQQQWVTDPRTNCRALDADFDQGDSVQWQGACVAGMINGPGTLSFVNDGHILETITGTFNSGALMPGHVSASWSDGSKYDGGQSGGQFDDAGNFVSATGDKISGQWKSGALNGKASVIWANGDRYDGEWKDGKSNGQGTEIWANGHKYEGLWKDGAPAPQDVTTTAQTNSAGAAVAAAIPAPIAPVPQVALASDVAPAPHFVPAVATPQDTHTEAPASQLPLHDYVGKTLSAVDGSTIDLSQGEGGLTRIVTLPTGVAQQTSFAFMNERIGTVSNESSAIGLFRADGDEIDTNYIDGKTEVMKPGPSGGLLLRSRGPDGNSVCTAWYPDGHVFSQDEKKAAVEEYASRLGVSAVQAPKKHHAVHAGAQSCGGGFVTSVTPTISATAAATLTASPAPQPAVHQTPVSIRSATPDSNNPAHALQAIPVKDSPVHLIDAPYEPETAAKPIQNITFGSDATAAQMPSPAPISPLPSAQDIPNASQCLTVTINGEYWGFQNSCGKALQFSYCEMSDANPLTACHHASVSGSVAANGFSALINDKNLSEQGAKHQFRWMACDGGAGEVVPHLDNVDPPSGRCLRAVPIGSGPSASPAGS